MTVPHRQNRCDTVLALIDERLADLDRNPAPRPDGRSPRTPEVLP